MVCTGTESGHKSGCRAAALRARSGDRRIQTTGQRYLPDPLSWIVWFAFAALSEIVTVQDGKPGQDAGPGLAGINSTVSVHVFCGSNCWGQFVADPANPNTCGLVTWTENAARL